MLEIVLVRHAETAWNKEEVFRGRADIALNETGQRQADLLAEYLADGPVDIVYSSPLRRAVQTAEAIAARHSLEVTIAENLIDFDFGEWQGMTLREVEKKDDELYRDWRDLPEQVRVPGGETLEEVRNRAWNFIDDAVMRCGDGRIVFVSHRVINKVVICTLLGLDSSHFWNIQVDTCGITRFACGDGRLVLTVHNDTSFLRSLRCDPLGDF